MEATGASEESWKLIGGRLCLDFANTVGWHAGDHPSESLNSYADLVQWSRQAGVLVDDQARQLLQDAEKSPAAGLEVFERAIALREAMYRVFSAVAAGRAVEWPDLEMVNSELGEAMAHIRIIPSGDGFTWDWERDTAALDRMLWPVVRSAGELLTSGELGRVRECAGHTCGWLFVDLSRNRSRRWCDMEDCGNRAKANRHYQRTRRAKATEA